MTTRPTPAHSTHPATMPASHDRVPIAIVGMGCRFPGGASSGDKFWDLITRKVSARRATPPDRFNIDAFYHPDGERNGTLNVRDGHFLDEDIAAFDSKFFSISPAEAVSMDPMQRMLLEVVYEATENAGIPLSRLAGSDTGCYVGCFSNDYDQLAKKDPETLPRYHSVGTGQSILSNRVSFCLDLAGPSMTVDTACSSSLVAVHMACQALRAGECSAAIVGATQATLSPDMMVGMTNLHFLSPDGACHAFDERANGYARGEGMAALVLKPLDLAVRDGDVVRAVIRGTAVNSNGRNTGITLPSTRAQAQLIRAAYEQAGCDPALTGYFEAHGTGTQAGDPIEAAAIGETLGRLRPNGEEGKLYVGSVKTNIGHLEGASGLAGIIKAVMSLEKGVVAPNIWFEKGNPKIKFDDWRIRVPVEASPWPVAGLRRASVNSFGYGGTNGHIILDDAHHYMLERGIRGKHNTTLLADSVKPEGQEGTDDHSLPSSPRAGAEGIRTPSSGASDSSEKLWLHASRPLGERPRAFHISGHEKESVLGYAKELGEYISKHGDTLSLDDLAYTMCERRSLLDVGASAVASSVQQLTQELSVLSDITARSPEAPSLAFVFTGQGAQWWGMGRELLSYPVYANSIASCGRALESFGCSWSLIEELTRDQRTSRINEAEISQPLCSAVQIALVDLLASWNIRPERVVGHSSGEIAAAYATSALSLDDAMRAAYFRGLLSPLIRTKGHKGSMLAAGLSSEEAEREITDMGTGFGEIVVACVNSPRSVTLSGDTTAVEEMQKILTQKRFFARQLQVETAYHSPHMRSIAEEYKKNLAPIETRPWTERKAVKMFSSVRGRLVDASDDLGASYWVDNMVSQVRFSEALAQLCQDQDSKQVDALVEVGPHSALAGPVKQILASLPERETSVSYHSALIRERQNPRGAAVTAVSLASDLFSLGYPTDMRAVNFPSPPSASGGHGHSWEGQTCGPRVMVDLPTYRWNRSRKYWAESRLSRQYRFRPFPRTDLLGAPAHDWNPMEPRWRNFIRLSEQPWVAGHKIQSAVAYPAAGYCCMAAEALLQLHKLAGESRSSSTIKEFKLRSVEITRALLVPQSDEGVEVSFTIKQAESKASGGIDTSTWSEFDIYSYTDEAGWQHHCRGLASILYREDEEGDDMSANLAVESRAKLLEAKKLPLTSMPCSEVYSSFDKVGLGYGPEFQGISSVSATDRQALGRVRVTDTTSAMPKGFAFDRILHPATVDALLQMGLVATTGGNLSNLTKPFVPTHISEVNISGNISGNVGQEFEVVADTEARGFRELSSNVSALELSGEAAIAMTGIKLVSIASASAGGSLSSAPKLMAKAIWEPDVDLLSMQKAHGILDAAEDDYDYESLRDREFLGYYFINQVLETVGEDEYDGMLPHHQKFFRYMQHQRDMVRSGTHEQQTDDWSNLDDPRVKQRALSLIQKLKTSDPEGQMFLRMGSALTAVLRQEVDPLGLMTGDGLLFDYYHYAPGSHGTYPKVERYLSLLSHKYPDLEYLEIGAGTGGCTRPALSALTRGGGRSYQRFKSYAYTDISSGFFEQAAAKFSETAEAMEFRRLDIERDPEGQAGFEGGRKFDVVVAANVLHATEDMSRTMRHVRKLLRPGGKLVLLEVTHSTIGLSLVFGNLPGWWACAEPWREYGPLLTEKQWTQTLRDTGFSGFEVCSRDVEDPLLHQANVIVATAIVEPPMAPVANNKSTVSGVLVVTPTGGVAAEDDLVSKTVSALSSLGLFVETCSFAESLEKDLAGRAVISFAELVEALIANISAQDFPTLQRLVEKSAGMLWVTRGAGRSSGGGAKPEMAVFQGLARTLRGENEHVPCMTLDLDAENPLPEDEAARLVLSAFGQNFGIGGEARETLGGKDRELVECDGVIRIKRAIENDKLDQLIAARVKSTPLQPEDEDISDSGRSLCLHVPVVGNLDSLRFDDDPAISTVDALAPDHVEVRVSAVGVNPRDAHICMGDVVDDRVGNECAGVVTKTGNAVSTLSPGDRVVLWCAGAYATVIHCPAALAQKIPKDMGLELAASLPVAYTTAYYSLFHVGRAVEGEAVLVHSAGGSVGKVAVEMAMERGCRTFATVTSIEDRDILVSRYGISETNVFLSNDATLTARIREINGGDGVDMVINSLAGKAEEAAWQVIAPLGRFVDLVNNPSHTTTTPPGVSYTQVDMLAVLRTAPKLAATVFEQVMRRIRDQTYSSSIPPAVKPMSKLADCLRASLTEEAKTVLTFKQRDAVPVIPKRLQHIKFRPDGSYLLVGGLGGIGRSLSRWMLKYGAQNFIYVSRRGVSSPEAATLVEDLRSAGARVEIIRCGVEDEETLSRLLSDALISMPPIRGVVTAAMDIKDQLFANMPYETFSAGTRPKVQGSWSLHRATLGQPLDFFVMLSSAAAFFGSIAQSNYVAACTYQVALAAHRRSLGLPAASLDVGKIVGIGYVAEDGTGASGRNLNHLGMMDVHEDELLCHIELAMLSSSSPQADAALVDGHLLTGIHSTNDPDRGVELPFWGRDPVFSHMDFARPHLRRSKQSGEDGINGTEVQKPLPELLGTATSQAEASKYILAALGQKLARALMMTAATDLDPKKGLGAYGVDSLIAVELRNWLSREAGVEMPVFEILQAASIAGLAKQVAAKSTLVSAKE